MLSDEDFLAEMMPKLRAKLAAQGRTGDSSHDSPASPSSPKNDPNESLRMPGHVGWFPVEVNARTKFGTWEVVQLRGIAEPVYAPLSNEFDGIVKLETPYMNLDAERVTLISVDHLNIPGHKKIKGERVRTETEVIRVTMLGMDAQPHREYKMDLPARSHDHQIEKLIRLWEGRFQARKKCREDKKVKLEALMKVAGDIDMDKVKAQINEYLKP
ncbi:hypothetical protein [Streptomyces sp. NPDC006477]|uniref:hypothetical protein n=1 Tax=Streptomyces sp. NPDC006477 TaxID=3364747 RepID=UPI0036CF75DE